MPGVLPTHSNHLFADRKQVEKMQPYPPLQTLIAAAVLKEQGIPTGLFDPALVAPEEGFEAALDRPQAGSRGGVRRRLQFPFQDVSREKSRAGVSNVRVVAAARNPGGGAWGRRV